MPDTLREKIAEEVRNYARYMAGGAGTPLDVAYRILALIEAEAASDRAKVDAIFENAAKPNLGHSISTNTKEG